MMAATMMHRVASTLLSVGILMNGDAAVVDVINDRFAAADSETLENNVILHQFGHCEDDENPTSTKCYLPCPPDVDACRKSADRMSTTLLSASVKDTNGNIPIYLKVGGGVIVRPNTAELLCGWSADGGTNARQCAPLYVSDTCVPGCYGTGINGAPVWCEDRENPGNDCPWKPDDFSLLKTKIVSHAAEGPDNYNELVFDAKSWSEHVADTIEAFFVTSTTDAAFTITQRQMYLEEYQKAPEDVPLLSLDLSNFEAPFTDISSSVEERRTGLRR